MLRPNFPKIIIISIFLLMLSIGCFGQDEKIQECAESDFDCSIKANPSDAEAYFRGGFINALRGKNKSAVEYLNKAIELNPNNANAYYIRGLVYKNNHPKQAVADFSEAIRIYPLNADAYYFRGLIYLNSNIYQKGEKITEAVEDFTKAIEINPIKAEYYFKRADCYLAKEDFNQAIDDYSRAIEIEPMPAYYNWRAVTYERIGEKEKAEADYDRYNELIKSSKSYL